jgi:MoaA/NifB/PqqE/SkfB family radical SAM enzyme
VDRSHEMQEMTTQQILSMVDDLHGMGTRMISFLGGEALLVKEIDAIIDHIQSKGILCDMVTNATLVEKRLDVIKRLDAICISLDGDQEANDFTRGQGTYERITAGIRIAQQAGVGVRVNCVITRHNREKFLHVLELGKKMGFPVSFGMPFEPELKEMLLDEAEARQFYQDLTLLKRQGYPVVFSNRTMQYMANYPLHPDELIYRSTMHQIKPRLKPEYRVECPYGRYIAYIHSDGTLLPCNNLYKLHVKGINICEVGVRAAWEHFSNLDCFNCYEGGSPEWNYMTSFSGMLHGLHMTMKQALGRRL